MGKNSVYRMIPDVGAILVWVDGGAKKRGEDPAYIQKILYHLPDVKTVKLED
jgi:hypothetical protein